MARGDQIYVMRPLINMKGAYEHHGIDYGDGSVIHYYKGGEEPTITQTSFDTFALGNSVFVKPYQVSYVPDVVIERAESRLGERQYQLLTNNCEHFATWCKVGRSESQQLIDYGMGFGDFNPFDSGILLDSASTTGDPIKTVELFTRALNNATQARDRLLADVQRTQTEMDSWQRVAQVALDQGREDLARAALERKVNYKRQWNQIQAQLRQLDEMQEPLMRNFDKLQQQIQFDPTYSVLT